MSDNPFLSARDTYRVVAVSTGHLTSSDMRYLEGVSKYVVDTERDNMVMARDTGWFIKLYDEPEYNQRVGLSIAANELLKLAHMAGFKMVEFDSEAEVVDGIPSMNPTQHPQAVRTQKALRRPQLSGMERIQLGTIASTNTTQRLRGNWNGRLKNV